MSIKPEQSDQIQTLYKQLDDLHEENDQLKKELLEAYRLANKYRLMAEKEVQHA